MTNLITARFTSTTYEYAFEDDVIYFEIYNGFRISARKKNILCEVHFY